MTDILINTAHMPCRTCPQGKCYGKCSDYEKWLRTPAVVYCEQCKFYKPVASYYGYCELCKMHKAGNSYCSDGSLKK